MLEHFMTEERFRQGVSQYLKEFSYKNAETEDLWNALSEQETADALPEGVTVNQIMKTWTSQPGYPVVMYDGHSLNQTRFFFNNSLGKLVLSNVLDMYQI